MRFTKAAVPVFLVVALLGACSSDDSAGPDDTSTASTDTTTTAANGSDAELPEPEQFEGTLDEFYVPPEPLPEGEPGQLIRVQEVSRTEDEVTVRVMHHSRDAKDRDRVATGIVTYPTGEAPDDGWPVITSAPGTIGLASSCALSRSDGAAPAFGVDGIRARTDYIGMGPPGETQAYLSRLSEGHSVLDAARAARQLVGDDASDRLLIFGHSQGGHGAQSAHELAATYAPELELLGTVSGAPAAMFEKTYGGIDDIVSRIVTTMGLFGVATDHPEIDPADYLNPDALAATEAFDELCLGEVIATFAPLAIAAPYWTADPTTTEPARSVLLANDVGNAVADAPMLLISGTEDERVVHERVVDLFGRLCENGQTTEFLVLEGANHDNEIPIAQDRIEAWYADRLSGAEPTDSCEP